MIKRQYCNYEANASVFKLLRDPWKHSFYTVRIMLELPKRYEVFNYYSSISPHEGKVIEFAMEVRPRS